MLFRSVSQSRYGRGIQEEIYNIEGLKNAYELNLEALNNELKELESDLYDMEKTEDYAGKQNDIDAMLEQIADKENEVQECEADYSRYSEELTELEELKGEISNNSEEGFEYGIQLIHEDDIDEYLHGLLIDCGYLPKDLPHWIEIDWYVVGKVGTVMTWKRLSFVSTSRCSSNRGVMLVASGVRS